MYLNSTTVISNRSILLDQSLSQLKDAVYPNILYIPIGFTAILSNLIVFYTIIKAKDLHTKCFILLAINSCCDFLLGAGYMTVGIVRVTRLYTGHGEMVSIWRCVFEVCDITFGQLISLGMAGALVIDRLASVYYWREYRLWNRKKWASGLVAGAFVYALCQLSVHFYDSWNNRDQYILTCGIENTITSGNSNILLSIQITTSLLVILLNFVLWFGVRRRRRKIRAAAVAAVTSAAIARREIQREKAKFDKESKTFKTITIIVVMHVLSHLSSRLIIFILSQVASDEVITMANRYGRALVETNAALHFFILYATSGQFKAAVKNVSFKIAGTANADGD